MGFSAFFSKLGRWQRTTPFKIGASIAVVIAAAVALWVYLVAANNPADQGGAPGAASATTAPPAAEGEPSRPEDVSERQLSEQTAQTGKLERDTQVEGDRSALDSTQRILGEIVQARQDPTNVAISLAIVTGLALTVVWLGLALTYLGLVVVAGLLAWPLSILGLTNAAHLTLGVVALTAAFATLMQALRLALSGSGAVRAIARNVLAEAVRLKLSLVFIVLLVLLLAALPLQLDPASPLRYRVQSFLQYGTGISFWIIALLVVLLSVASVTYEQRDRVIWQTMTKPVPPWKYILGKWVGVAGLAAVLLAVCGSGIFLFTEYLRSQPAKGEDSPYVTMRGGVTHDRYLLEKQVLTSRESVAFQPPQIDMEQFNKSVLARIENEIKSNPDFKDTNENKARLEREMRDAALLGYRSIEPGQFETYVFRGLKKVKEAGEPITLRFKINSGANAPDQIYKLTFWPSARAPFRQESVLGQMQSIELVPDVIDADGNLYLRVYNADISTDPPSTNPDTITFPPDGLEVSYPVSSFRWNFLRVVGVLWIKLAFLAMVGVATSTFLSFPVACLVSLGIFFMAESSSFLLSSLENYSTTDYDGNPVLMKIIVANISQVVAQAFRIYGELRPVGRLADGLLLPWSAVATGLAGLAVMSGVLYAAAVAIFRRRELAIYSGH
ncbi:MAG: hypothetical protein SFZ23_02160 [Planctomycetota bacterium]|nr:hypothetical protein [Planctomycetota bacterium]